MDIQNQKPVETGATSAPPEQVRLLGGEGSFETFDTAKRNADIKANVMRQLLECEPKPPTDILDVQRRAVWSAHQKVLNLGIPKQGSAIDTK